jgi:starch phosphorylase
LEELARDDDVVRGAASAAEALEEALEAATEPVAGAAPGHPIAFVCAEFGIHASLPIYSGGLGVLAGDVLKEASDRRLPLVGVGLLYAHGNFRQRIDPTGLQQDFWIDLDVDGLPAVPVTREDGVPLTIEVPIGDHAVTVGVRRVDVGRVPLYLLDAAVADNDVLDRWITGRLYVGDREARLEQYALLGVGAIRALDAMGLDPAVVHLNEGHAAFAPLELARRQAEADGSDRAAVIAAARARTVFTTHTPVEAGNESYPLGMVTSVLGEPFAGWEDTIERLGGGAGSAGEAGMTTLGLRLSRKATGVSRLHGAVARRMWAPLFPEAKPEDVPIGHVTNGVHLPTWMGAPMRELLDRRLGTGWLERSHEPSTWEPVAGFPDAELWSVRERMRGSLVDYVRGADATARLARYESREAVHAASDAFRPDRLTLGFARRVATYKRLELLFRDLDRVVSLLRKPDTVQIVIAGKAHPRDLDAKEHLARFFRAPWPDQVAGRITFLEDYDMDMAARLVAGCDVWLNLPRPPMEASGTSGMKSAMNGGLNLSVLDGWWAEAYDGTNGWAVGDAVEADGGPLSGDGRDSPDAEALYDLIEGPVLETFHERDRAGVPGRWIAMVKSSLMTNGPRFGASRMLRDYAQQVWPA